MASKRTLLDALRRHGTAGPSIRGRRRFSRRCLTVVGDGSRSPGGQNNKRKDGNLQRHSHENFLRSGVVGGHCPDGVSAGLLEGVCRQQQHDPRPAGDVCRTGAFARELLWKVELLPAAVAAFDNVAGRSAVAH